MWQNNSTTNNACNSCKENLNTNNAKISRRQRKCNNWKKCKVTSYVVSTDMSGLQQDKDRQLLSAGCLKNNTYIQLRKFSLKFFGLTGLLSCGADYPPPKKKNLWQFWCKFFKCHTHLWSINCLDPSTARCFMTVNNVGTQVHEIFTGEVKWVGFNVPINTV